MIWKGIRLSMLLGLMGLSLLPARSAGAAEAPLCDERPACGLLGGPSDQAYQGVILGKVVNVLDEKTEAGIFDWARRHGYWSQLPEDPAAFTRGVQMLSVEIPVGDHIQPVTLLMGRKDFMAAGIEAGDFIRYRPHPTDQVGLPGYPLDPKDPYWAVFGCMAVLCTKDDIACPSGYVPGVYDQAGRPRDLETGQPDLTRGPIDPMTYRPVRQRLLGAGRSSIPLLQPNP